MYQTIKGILIFPMEYYKEPFEIALEADKAIQYRKYKKALIMYTEALDIALKLYKKDEDNNRKNKIYPELQKIFDSAETMKMIVRMPKVPSHGRKLSPVEEIEEELDSIKISNDDT